jgi:maleylpyruvate isomerase
MSVLDRYVEGCAAAHQTLLGLLDSIEPASVREPSLLPNWSRAHVLSHLARNAEGLKRFFVAAEDGCVGEQYPGGRIKRDADIDDGARRDFGDIVSEVRSSIWNLEGAWARASAEVWASKGRLLTGAEVTLEESVFRRWREVVVHTSDLGYDYTWAEWPTDYVRFELDRQLMAWRASQPMGVKDFPDHVRRLPDTERLAWLLQRTSVDGLGLGPGI